MPPEHRREVLASVFAAVMSTVYFVTLGILLQPIPSRSLAAVMLMPNAALTPTTALIANAELSTRPLPDARPVAAVHAYARRAGRAHPMRPVATVQLAAVGEAPTVGSRTVALGSTRERPRNLVSRFFHGVLHAVQPGPKADLP